MKNLQHLAAISMVDKRMEIRAMNQETNVETMEEIEEKKEKEETEIESFPNKPSPWTECTILWVYRILRVP